MFSLQFNNQCTRRVEGPRRAPCQLEKPFKGPQRRGSCWEEWKRTVFTQLGVIDLPSIQANQWFLTRLKQQKKWVSGQTWGRGSGAIIFILFGSFGSDEAEFFSPQTPALVTVFFFCSLLVLLVEGPSSSDEASVDLFRLWLSWLTATACCFEMSGRRCL